MNRLIEEVASAKPPAARPPPPPKSLVDMPPALPSLKYVETPDDAYRYSQDAPYHKHVPQVYPDSLGFDWHDCDYQITPSSRKYVQKFNQNVPEGEK